MLNSNYPVSPSREESADEGVDGAVHDGVYVACFLVCAVVFDHGIGLEDVGADLAAPFDFLLIALKFGDFGFFLFLFEFKEFGAEHF